MNRSTVVLSFFALMMACLCVADEPSEAKMVQRRFTGTWKTVRNRKLDGTMHCIANQIGQKWACRFYGTWQGIKFDYTVRMEGPDDKLVGHQITIDGARYQWTGTIKNGVFHGEFESGRYEGTFELTEKKGK